MHIVYIGCTHAGTNAALKVKQLHPEIDVTIIERNASVSFLSCGIAIGCQLKTPLEKMFYCSVEEMNKLGIKTLMECDAQNIDFAQKTIEVKSLKDGGVSTVSFDTLVLSCGSWPVIPGFVGDYKRFKNLFLCKNFVHGGEIFDYMHKNSKQGKKVAILGGGYIGVELCEAFAEHGYAVKCVEGEDRIMKRYFDKDYTDVAEETLTKHGTELILKKLVTGLEQKGEQLELKFNDNTSIIVDACVLSIGFKPNTDFILQSAEKQGVKFDHIRGAFKTNEYCQTNIPGIYAIGDSALCHLNPSNQLAYIPLATNAVRQAVASASHVLH